MTKPLVLFCIDRWLDVNNRGRGETLHRFAAIGSLETIDAGKAHVFFYDECVAAGDSVDKKMVEACESLRPALVFVTPRDLEGYPNLTPQACEFIRDELKIPVVIEWLESSPSVVARAETYASHVTKTVFTDTAEHWRRPAQSSDSYARLLEPRDTRVFFASNGLRDFPCTFLGEVVRRPDRAYTLAYLWSNGAVVYHAGGVQTGLLTVGQYAEMLRRSRVTLGFTSAVTFQQLKGRTVEAMLCGAMLLESASDETLAAFEPFVHYVPFTMPFSFNGVAKTITQQDSDLLQKVKYYLADNPQEAAAIARRGHDRAVELFDGRLFWKSLFEMAGVAA